MSPAPIKKLCPSCQKMRRVEEFGWSKRKKRPNVYCYHCWGTPRRNRLINGSESTEELLLYYTEIRSLMINLHEAQAEALAKGLPADRQIASLGDVWVSQMTEEAYSAIVQALIDKASRGDVHAAKLLLEERHRRAGEPTKESVEQSFEGLFNVDPLTPNLDTD